MTPRSHWRAIFGDCAARTPRIAPTAIEIGLPAKSIAKSPRASGVRNASAEIMFTRGVFCAGRLLRVCIRLVSDIFFQLLFAPALQLVNQIVGREAMCFCFGDEAVRQIALMFVVVPATAGFEMAGAHQCSDPSSRLHNSRSLELGIDFCHGIGVYAKIDSQLSHRRQLIALTQLSGGHGEADRSLQLRIKWHRVRSVDGEHLT